MKIIEVIPSLGVAGGGEKFVIDLSIALKKLGNEVLIIVLYKDDTVFYKKEIDEHKLSLIFLNKHPGFDYKNSRRLKEVIQSFRPDVVHTHLNSHLSMFLSTLWKKSSGIKFLHTIHNIPNVECKKPILYRIMKWMYRRNIVVPVAISKHLADETKRYYNLQYEVPFIENGIFLDVFDASKPIITRSHTFISLANFHESKNQISIVKASLNLKQKGYNFNVLFVGDGALFNKVKTYSSQHGADNFISFLGRRKDISSLLSDSKCLILPSFFEGHPISILESMASGLAIITTEIGGPKDIIEDGINGFLVDPYNIDSISNAMEYIIKNDGSDLEKFSKNNLEKSKKYDIFNVANQYLGMMKKKE